MTCELLRQRHRRKNFLHRIVMSDEKWILKCKNHSADQANYQSSTAKSNIHDAMLGVGSAVVC